MSGEDPHALESNPSTQIPLAPPPGLEGTWAVSLAEIDAMGRKAARGAGLPWGLAEEAGRAARHLAAWGLPGPEALAALVAALDGAAPAHAPRVEGGPWRAWAGALCPVSTGAALSDHAAEIADGAEIRLGPVLRPVLLLPFLVRAARDLDVLIGLEGADVAAAALPAGPAAGDWAWAGSGRLGGLAIRRVAGSAHVPRHADAGARPVALATWRALDRYAHRTYAPATEASRAGAGAGLTDSD